MFLRCSSVVALVITTLVRVANSDDLKGFVRDSDGKPIAGARVDIVTAAPKVGRAIFCPSCYADCAKFTVTSADGSFTLMDLDPSLKFTLLSTATGKQSAGTSLLDPRRDVAELVLEDFPANVRPTRLLRGILISEERVPIAGALVYPHGAKSSAKGQWSGPVNAKPAISDETGGFQMLLGEDLQGVDLSISASGFAGTLAKLLPPGAKEHRIVVPRGAIVRGRIVHG